MSSDLLAEFESFYQPSQAVSKPPKQKSVVSSTLRNNATDEETLDWWGSLDTTAQDPSIVKDANVNANDVNLLDAGFPDGEMGAFAVEAQEDDGMDDWGDFEAADISTNHAAASTDGLGSAIDSGVTILIDKALQSTTPASGSDEHSTREYQTPSKVVQSTETKPYPPKAPRDENILFDADDEADQDDFGDFETARTVDTPIVVTLAPIQQATPSFQRAPEPLLPSEQRLRSNGPAMNSLADLSLLDFDTEPMSVSNRILPNQHMGSGSLFDLDNHINDTTTMRPDSVHAQTSPPPMEDFKSRLHNPPQPTSESRTNDDDDAWNDFEDFDAAPKVSEQTTNATMILPAAPAQLNLDKIQSFSPIENSSLNILRHAPPSESPRLSQHVPRDRSPLARSSASSPTPKLKEYQASPKSNTLVEAASTTLPAATMLPSPTPQAIKTPSLPPLDLPSILPTSSSTSDIAPPNIPPPSLILSLFPPLITLTRIKLLDVVANTSSPAVRTAILNHAATQTFLTSYLAIASVLARVLAGRKLRWKRDAALAQSMRIGPAGAGHGGGMKLTTLDKAELAKEDREAADVVRLWRVSLGRLRAAVGPGHAVPEVAETLPVRTATAAEGAVQATRACALCGLKRNERVGRMDADVLDSFGEWWVEHWGHRECANFWAGQSGNLAAR